MLPVKIKDFLKDPAKYIPIIIIADGSLIVLACFSLLFCIYVRTTEQQA